MVSGNSGRNSFYKKPCQLLSLSSIYKDNMIGVATVHKFDVLVLKSVLEEVGHKKDSW